MKTIVKFVFIISFLLYFCSGFAVACPIEGTWKSDAPKTIASLKSSKALVPSDVKVGELFGKQILKLDCKSLTSTYEKKVQTLKFKSVVINANDVTVTFLENKYGQNGSSTFTLEEDKKCISINHKDINFKEYYCHF
jgi:hypothetical protein